MPSSTQDPSTQAQHSVFGTVAYNAAGAAQMSFQPINQIHQHLCGLHVYAHDPDRAVEAHHYCTHLTPDMHQCVIYDSPGPNARLIGIEYVITEKAFVGLPEDEKRYWHSHKQEVESGMLKLGTKSVVPSMLDDLSERPAMLELHRTYGKTIHTWQYDKHPDIPLGPPTLMMSLTDDTAVEKHRDVLEKMDERIGVSSDKKRELRAGYLPKENMEQAVAEGADSGLKQRLQFELKPQ